MNWFKLYAEFATDPKVQAMTEPMQRRLIMLYCLKCSGDLAKLDDEEIALFLRITPAELEKTRDLFKRKGFIGERWSLPAWEKRQAPTDRTAAERMRRMRANKPEPANGVTEHVARNSRVTMQPEQRNEVKPLRVEEEGDTEEEGESPLPLVVPIPDDPISRECIRIAAERWGACNGDSVIGDFLRRHKPEYVRYAIDREWDKHGTRIQPAYLRSILQGIEDAGGLPKKPGEDRGRTAVQQRPEETRASIKPPNFYELPDTPETRGVRAVWEGRAA